MLVSMLVRRLFRLQFMICRALNIFEPSLLGSICHFRLCRAQEECIHALTDVLLMVSAVLKYRGSYIAALVLL